MRWRVEPKYSRSARGRNIQVIVDASTLHRLTTSYTFVHRISLAAHNVYISHPPKYSRRAKKGRWLTSNCLDGSCIHFIALNPELLQVLPEVAEALRLQPPTAPEEYSRQGALG